MLALQNTKVSPGAVPGLSVITDQSLLSWVVFGQNPRQIMVSCLLFPHLCKRAFLLLSSVFSIYSAHRALSMPVLSSVLYQNQAGSAVLVVS